MTHLVLFLTFTIFVNIVNASYCGNFKQKYAPAERFISQYGEPKNISVYWDSDPTRAAAALLTVILRHVLGYQYVQLQQSLLDSSPSMPSVSCGQKGLFKEIQLKLTIDSNLKYDNNFDPESIQRLHVHVAKGLRDKQQCADADVNQENFYNDTFKLTDCGFEIIPTRTGQIMYIYHLDSTITTAVEIVSSWLKTSNKLVFKKLNRMKLYQMLEMGNQSFLFIDYNMWDGDKDVRVLQLNPCLECENSKKDIKNNIIVTTTRTVSCREDEYAPELFHMARIFTPSLQSLRPVLELESIGKDIVDANCEWISKQNYTVIDKLMNEYIPKKKHYKIMTFTCEEKNYERKLITNLGNFIWKHYFKLRLVNYADNCTDPNYVTRLLNFMRERITPSHIGAVVEGLKNIKEHNVPEILDKSPVPVFLYDAIDINVDITKSVWLTNGRLTHLMLALENFITTKDITQVTVLSEQTLTAEYFNNNLKEVHDLKFVNYNVPLNLTDQKAEILLRKVEIGYRNMIIVNTNYDNAVIILSAAIKLNMNDDNEFTWILRERAHKNISLDITYLTFSFWSMNEHDAAIDDMRNFKHIMKTIKPDDRWQPHEMAYVDAVLTLVTGFNDVILKYPQARDDPQSKQVIDQFERSLSKMSPVEVVFQNPTYKKHSAEEVLVFVDLWQDNQSKILAQYRVNATARSVQLIEKTETLLHLKGYGNNLHTSLHNYNILLLIAYHFYCISVL